MDTFTIGCVGYSNDKFNIKNLDVIADLANRRPTWNFELIINRDNFPESFQDASNIRVHTQISNEKIPKIMARWSCYLGLSKRERGPATIQEANALGCPTVCANHTGYACFQPLVPLDLPPFVDLSRAHIWHIEETLVKIEKNRSFYLDQANQRRKNYWSTQTPENTTHKWKSFLLNCLEG